MKMLHTLKTSWLILAMVVAVVIGEAMATQLSSLFGVRFSAVAVGAASIGVVVLIVSLIYDGRD
jgi:hypothetical protein